MSILLICKNASGNAAVEDRRYPIRGHYVVMRGYSDEVVHRDVEELLSVPDGFYRLSTPDEQERFTVAQRTKGMIQE